MLRASSKPLFRIPEKKRAVNPYTPRLEPSRSLAGRIEVPAPNAAVSFETKPSRECLHTPKKDQHRRKNYRNHDTAWQSVLGWTFPVHHRERKHSHICVHYPLASEPNLYQNLDHKMRLTLCDAPRLTKSITPMETGCWTKAEGQNFAKIQCRSICIGGGVSAYGPHEQSIRRTSMVQFCGRFTQNTSVVSIAFHLILYQCVKKDPATPSWDTSSNFPGSHTRRMGRRGNGGDPCCNIGLLYHTQDNASH